MNYTRINELAKKSTPYITLGFFILVSWLLYRNLSRIDWNQFRDSFSRLSSGILISCFGLVLLNFLILTTFDFMGFRHIQDKIMTWPKVVVSAFCSYVFNLNLGALIGGVGFRFRIYTGWGVSAASVSKIVLFSSLTNWLGHTSLLALVFCFKSQAMSGLLHVPEWLIIGYGASTLILVGLYFVLCQREFVLNLKGISFPFPKLPKAFLQLILSASQWGIISIIIYLLIRHLGEEIAFEQVLMTTLIASIAGIFTHIPAGLGVLEAIFLQMNLGVDSASLLAALVCYRALYYFVPLLMAIPTFLLLESRQKLTIREYE